MHPVRTAEQATDMTALRPVATYSTAANKAPNPKNTPAQTRGLVIRFRYSTAADWWHTMLNTGMITPVRMAEAVLS